MAERSASNCHCKRNLEAATEELPSNEVEVPVHIPITTNFKESDIFKKNEGCDFDEGWINKTNRINQSCVKYLCDSMMESKMPLIQGSNRIAWLLRAVTCIDLTTLAGDDTRSHIHRLCHKAADPIPRDILVDLGLMEKITDEPGILDIKTAAVCVYPLRVPDAVEAIKRMGLRHKIAVASVAAGFPSGQYFMRTRLDEIRCAIECGATEIDIVINRSLVITKQWSKLYDELKQMREVCGKNVLMKTILGTGELETLTDVYKASLVAMMAGSDFIKTSTGKEAVNATLPVAFVMCRAIKDYYHKTGFTVGFKPAGGIRTAADTIQYLIIVKQQLGRPWMNSQLFRIGASGVLLDIVNELFYFLHNHYPDKRDMLLE